MFPKPNFSNVIVLFSLITLFCYVFSAYFFITENDANTCRMTYMYEYPQYVKINLSTHIEKTHRRYALYAYSEGKYIERAKLMKFTGVPVLFVPGNGGSYKQVRSLASVTNHRTWDLQSIFHFDFFTIDFQGELSALYGGTLREQHDFIVVCVNRVMSLYSRNSRPGSVVIIGHSMGGMIAKSLFMNPSFEPSFVKLIITLATPHQPVILIDKNLKEFYQSADTFWEEEKSKNRNRMENLTLISIGGGAKDVLVRPGLSYYNLADLNVLTNAIPNVITSTDHVCIVWCNNFIRILSRALYDSVDFDVKGITENKKHLLKIFYYHLIHCSNGKYYSTEIHRDKIKFTRNSTWREAKRNYTSLLYPKGVTKDTHVLILKPKDISEYDSIMLEAVNIDKRDWVAECNVQYDHNLTYCEDGENLSQFGIIGFNKTYRRKYFRHTFKSDGVFHKHLRYLIVRLASTTERTGLNMDLYDEKSRTIEVNLDFFSLWERKTIIDKTHPRAMFYSIRFNNMVNMWKVYHLHLIPLNCNENRHAASAVFKTPWNHDGSNARMTWEKVQVLRMVLLTVPPREMKKVPFVELTLDPFCSYTVQIESSLLDSFGALAVRYSFSLISNLTVLLLLTLNYQYTTVIRTQICPSFLEALKNGKAQYLVYPLIKLISYLWKLLELDKVVFKLDTELLIEDTADELIVPVIIYLIAFALLYVAGLCLKFSIIFNVFIYRKYSISEILKNYVTEELMNVVVPISSICSAVSIACLTCGGHGFITAAVFFYFYICRDYYKSLMFDGNSNLKMTAQATKELNMMNFNNTLLLLWQLCAVVYLPTSISWHKHFQFGIFFIRDSSFVFSVTCCCAVGFLWYCNVPHFTKKYSHCVSYPIYVIASIILLTCQVNIYRLPSFISPVFMLLAAHRYCGLILSRKQHMGGKNSNETEVSVREKEN